MMPRSREKKKPAKLSRAPCWRTRVGRIHFDVESFFAPSATPSTRRSSQPNCILETALRACKRLQGGLFASFGLGGQLMGLTHGESDEKELEKAPVKMEAVLVLSKNGMQNREKQHNGTHST